MEMLKVFNTLTLKQIFSKMKTFSKSLEFGFLVESTKNTIFPNNAALSGANVKTNKMGIT